MLATNDKMIRAALLKLLAKEIRAYASGETAARIFQEFGVRHGTTRIDVAVVNGILHGYEIKSDPDTLDRLPEQAKQFSSVFDKITLVVGKRHLYHALHIIPEWWGLKIAVIDEANQVVFHTIRGEIENVGQSALSLAKLLWRGEALTLLQEKDEAKGFKSKPRRFIYEKLVNSMDIDTLKNRVHVQLVSRQDWRSDPQPMLYDG